MAIIGAQDHVAAVQSAFGDGGDLAFDIIPRRAEPDHGPHPLPHARDGVRLAGALMIIRWPTSHVGRKGRPQIWRGIVPAHGFTCTLCCRNLGQHLRVGVDHTGEVHHLAKADNTFPRHGLRYVFGGDLEPCCLHPRCAGRAGGHLGEDVNGLHQRLVMHHADTFKTQYIGDLVRIGEHGCCAMGDHGAGEFGGGEHAALDVHMPVAQTGDHVAALRLDHLRVRPATMIGGRTDKGDAPLHDGNVVIRKGFARVNIHPDAAGDDHVGRAAACSDIHQIGGHIRPFGKTCMCHIATFHRVGACSSASKTDGDCMVVQAGWTLGFWDG